MGSFSVKILSGVIKMASMMVQHSVKDFSAWKKVFDSFAPTRKSFGELSAQLYHDAQNPNKLTLLFGWNSIANAQKFAQSPELRAAMEKAGVDGAPTVSFLNEA
jgi:quinol monooxygenase YgiN